MDAVALTKGLTANGWTRPLGDESHPFLPISSSSLPITRQYLPSNIEKMGKGGNDRDERVRERMNGENGEVSVLTSPGRFSPSNTFPIYISFIITHFVPQLMVFHLQSILIQRMKVKDCMNEAMERDEESSLFVW